MLVLSHPDFFFIIVLFFGNILFSLLVFAIFQISALEFSLQEPPLTCQIGVDCSSQKTYLTFFYLSL